jgi:acyl dehydratase
VRPLHIDDDLRVGTMIELGETSVTAADILAFGERYDPQPFHVDPDAAAGSVFGGLIASGWQSCALYMQLFAVGVLNRTTSLGSPGVDELRWLGPVRPGDTLAGKVEVLENRSSRSRPERAILVTRGTLTNQDGDVVLSLVVTNLLQRQRAV